MKVYSDISKLLCRGLGPCVSRDIGVSNDKTFSQRNLDGVTIKIVM